MAQKDNITAYGVYWLCFGKAIVCCIAEAYDNDLVQYQAKTRFRSRTSIAFEKNFFVAMLAARRPDCDSFRFKHRRTILSSNVTIYTTITNIHTTTSIITLLLFRARPIEGPTGGELIDIGSI